MEEFDMKKLVLFAGALLIFGFSSLVLAETKMVVLDINKVIASLPYLKDVQADLKKKFDPRGQELINMQNVFRSNLDKYRQNNVDLKGEALKKEQQKIIDENKKVQAVRTSLQQDLVTAQNQALTPILQQIKVVVDKIAQTQKIDLVITRNSAAYFNPQIDITDQVISEMKKPVPVASPIVNPVVIKAPDSKK
jgi:outer membrane protein